MMIFFIIKLFFKSYFRFFLYGNKVIYVLYIYIYYLLYTLLLLTIFIYLFI